MNTKNIFLKTILFAATVILLQSCVTPGVQRAKNDLREKNLIWQAINETVDSQGGTLAEKSSKKRQMMREYLTQKGYTILDADPRLGPDALRYYTPEGKEEILWVKGSGLGLDLEEKATQGIQQGGSSSVYSTPGSITGVKYE